MQSAIRNPQSAIAFFGAIAVLLAGWLLPLPRQILSEEEEAATRMPQTMADVARARAEFDSAQLEYQGYIANNDVGAALEGMERAITQAQADPSEAVLRDAIRAMEQPVLDYLGTLQRYAQTGENYFGQLKHFDDELMAWTRSLGTGSESLRSDTWPIVEYLKLYPPPVGLNSEYPSVTAADIGNLAVRLSTTGADGDLNLLAQFISDVRAAGRSIEYTESLHTAYETLLQNYHTRLQAVAAGMSAEGLSGGRAIFAFGADALLAVLLVLGLTALFLSRKTIANESAP